MTDKTECGCTDECLHKPGCVFERKESALVSDERNLTEKLRDNWDGVNFNLRLEAAAEIDRLRAQLASARKALEEIIDAEKEFREQMGADWEGDPVSDACDRARLLLTDEEGKS